MKRSLALLTLLALGLTACGGDDGGTTTTPPATTAAPTTTAPAGDTVTIQELDFQFEPAEVTASTAQALELVNAGEAAHNFTIEGTDVTVDTQPGDTTRLEPPAPVEPGTYTFFCSFHRSQGMEGTITVVAG